MTTKDLLIREVAALSCTLVVIAVVAAVHWLFPAMNFMFTLVAVVAMDVYRLKWDAKP